MGEIIARKYVELIAFINKMIIVASIWLFILLNQVDQEYCFWTA